MKNRTLIIALIIAFLGTGVEGWSQNTPATQSPAPKALKAPAKPVGKAAQKQRRVETRAGNKAYRGKHYSDAETSYRKALTADSTYYKAQYNLGNTLYRQKNYGSAAEHFSSALQNSNMSKSERSRAYYNLGNSQLQSGLQERDGKGGGMENFQKAVQSYQESLKLNSKDKNAKYNLSYAKKMLVQSQQQKQKNGGGQGGGQQQKQGAGQQQQGQNNNQQGKGQQNQDRQNQDGQNQDQGSNNNPQQKKQSPKPNDAQKEQQKKEAERLLNAVKNNENNTMREQQKAKESKVDGRIEKDW